MHWIQFSSSSNSSIYDIINSILSIIELTFLRNWILVFILEYTYVLDNNCFHWHQNKRFNNIFYCRRYGQLFTSSKPGLQTYSKSSEWTRPLGTTDSIGSLAPPLPPTFLPPPNPLRLVASKSDAGRPNPLAQQQHPGPPTPTHKCLFWHCKPVVLNGRIEKKMFLFWN